MRRCEEGQKEKRNKRVVGEVGKKRNASREKKEMIKELRKCCTKRRGDEDEYREKRRGCRRLCEC